MGLAILCLPADWCMSQTTRRLRLSLIGNQSVKIYAGVIFADPGIKALDNFDGNISD